MQPVIAQQQHTARVGPAGTPHLPPRLLPHAASSPRALRIAHPRSTAAGLREQLGQLEEHILGSEMEVVRSSLAFWPRTAIVAAGQSFRWARCRPGSAGMLGLTAPPFRRRRRHLLSISNFTYPCTAPTLQVRRPAHLGASDMPQTGGRYPAAATTAAASSSSSSGSRSQGGAVCRPWG